MYDARHLKSILCGNLGGMEWGGKGEGFQDGGDTVWPWPIHTDVWQRPLQYWNYPPIKISDFFRKGLKYFINLITFHRN